MKTIIIAVSSEALGQQLSNELHKCYHIVLCREVSHIAESLPTMQPDVVVIDLMLSGVDSLGLLQAIRGQNKNIRIVAVTPYISDYILSMLERLSVCHLVRLPCDSIQLAARIRDIAQWDKANHREKDDIQQLLLFLGFSMQKESYSTILHSIEGYIALWQQAGKPPQLQILYQTVAQETQRTVTQVEKSLRDGIEAAWKSHWNRTWHFYFHTGKGGKTEKPTSGAFLSRISRAVMDGQNFPADSLQERKTVG